MTPQLSSGQFIGDALSGIGQGLLAYGAGGQARQQAGLIGAQGIQDAAARRQEAQYRAQQSQSLTQQLAQQQQQMQMQQQAMQQAGQQREAYKGLLGGQPIQGPTQSGAPLDMKSPVNPALSGLPPAIQQMLPAMDPDQGMSMIANLATAKPQSPTTVGGMQYDPTQKKFVPIPGYAEQASAIAAAGRAPQQAPSDVQEYQFAKSQGFPGSYMDYLGAKKGQGMSVTLPDGTVMQVGGTQKPVSESQAAAGSRATMIQDGVSKLQSLYNSPNISIPRSLGASVLDQFGPIGQAAGGALRSDDEQQWKAAQGAALEGLAAAVTGAGVTSGQFERYQSMLPQLTDKPETRKSKLAFANKFLQSQLTAAGPAGAALAKQIDAAPSASADQSATPTKVFKYNPATGKVE